MENKKQPKKKLTIEERIELLTQEGVQYERQMLTCKENATKAFGAIEVLKAMLEEEKEK